MNPALQALGDSFPRKRAFITGAGSGLGLALARALAAERWSLGLFDMNAQKLTAVEGELARDGLQIQAYPGDVTQHHELTVAVNSFSQTVEGLDLMINNAGVVCGGNILEVSPEDWRWIIDTNLMGVVHGCRAAIPHLQLSGKSLLLNIASAAAFASAPGMAPYNVSKAGVLSLSETLAMELADSGIRVAVALPGFFQTPLMDSYRGTSDGLETGRMMIENSNISAATMANEILREAGRGHTYIVLPKRYRSLWRLKRWMPLRYLKTFPELRKKGL